MARTATHKTCNTCRLTLPLSEFSPEKKGDGYKYRCKPCNRAASKTPEARERARVNAARWRARNPERFKEVQRAYYQRNPEARRATAQSWRDRNPERVMQYRREWYAANDGAALMAAKRAAHPLAAKAANSKSNWNRRTAPAARLRQLDPAVLAPLLCDPCAYCGEGAGTVDHIVPVSDGGTSEWQNLTGACKACNSSKRDKPLLTFLLHRRVVAASGC